MRSKHFVGILLGLFFLVFVPFVFWLSGFNFDERGETAAGCALLTAILSLGSMVIAFSAPDYSS